MSKREFINKLTEYLQYDLPAAMVREKIQFYSDYIDQEIMNGHRAEEVINDLGDPQLIAHSIIDAAKSGPDGIPGSADDVDYSGDIFGNGSGSRQESNAWNTGNDSAGQGQDTRNPWGGSIHTYNFGCFTGILILLIILSVFSLIGALIGVLSPILAPVCMVLLIMWFLRKLSGGGRW